MMASENASLRKLETTPFEMKRQHSYTTLARLIGAPDSNPGSPAAPSPRDAARMNRMVERLEEIDAESRELLRALFKMLDKDARLERYIRKRVEDPKVSHMWELVEQIMAAHHGHVDVDAILNANEMNDADDKVDDCIVPRGQKVRELKIEGGAGGDEMRLGRFKVRTFESDELDVVEDT